MKKLKIKCQGTSSVSIEKLKDFQGNLKELSRKNHKKLKNNLINDGFRIPIFIWKKNILDGHQRLKILNEMQGEEWLIPEIPVIELKAKNKQDAKKLLLLINSRYGKMTEQGLADFVSNANINFNEFMNDIDLPEINLSQFMDNYFPDNTKADDDIPKRVKPITKKGDLIELGRHRLLCGDSTIKEDVDELMDGNKADMVFTDPPYNINLGHISRGYNTYKDNKSINEYEMFVKRSLKNSLLVTKQDCNFYIFHANRDIVLFKNLFDSLKIKFHQWLFWIKSGGIWGNSDFIQNYEILIYGYIGKHRFYGSKGYPAAEVYQNDKSIGSKNHPTSKPIKLLEKYLKSGSKESMIILDLFLGSGSTLIASEKINRICYGMEIDQYYCDVIIQRYKDWCKSNKRECIIKRNGKKIN